LCRLSDSLCLCLDIVSMRMFSEVVPVALREGEVAHDDVDVRPRQCGSDVRPMQFRTRLDNIII
jgi:hypothetical protein